MDTNLLAVATLIVVALVFDYINGFHDAANSIATVVSTRVLTPGKAVIWAAFFNFVAAFTFGTAVASTVGSGLVDVTVVSFSVIFAGLTGAIVWDLITWYYGLPTSSSHALIGGYAGAAVIKAGWTAIIVSGWTKTLLFIVLAPMIGMTLGFLLMVAIMWVCSGTSPGRVDHWFRRLQLVSAAAYSLGHGGNDAQKTMGIIAGALFAGGYLNLVDGKLPIPFWVIMSRARRHRARHAVGRLADHPHDGVAHHQAHPGWWFRRGDRRSDLAVHGHSPWRAGQHHAHDHGRDHRCRVDPAPVGRALGCGGKDHLGVGAHHTRVGVHRRRRLLGRGEHHRAVAGFSLVQQPQSAASSTVKIAPPSRRFAALTRPSCSSTRCLTMARPNPVPPGSRSLRERALSTR